MAAQPESRFPNRLAYVLKLRGEATREAIAGRLENVVTGERVEFGSGRELLAVITRDLVATPTDGAAD